MTSTKSGPSAASSDKFWAMGKPILLYQYTTTSVDKSIKLYIGYIHPVVSEICILQSLDPIYVVPNLTSFWSMGKPIWATEVNGSAQLQA